MLTVFVRSVNWFNYQLGKVLRGFLWALMGVLVVGIISRYGFNAPIIWTKEVTSYIFVSYIFLGGGYILLIGGHVRMDALYSRWSVRRRAIMDAATFSLVAIWLVGYLRVGFKYAITSVMTGETFESGAQTPVGPIKCIIVGGVVILLIQALALFIQDLSIARGKPL